MIEDLRFRVVGIEDLAPGSMAFNIPHTNKFRVVEALVDGKWMQITGEGLKFKKQDSERLRKVK